MAAPPPSNPSTDPTSGGAPSRPEVRGGDFATLVRAWQLLVGSATSRRVLYLVLAGAAAWYAVAITADGRLQDFDAYFRGGWGLLHGGDPYDPRNPGSILPFVYPPFAAIVVVPFVLLGHRGGAMVLTLISLGLAFWTMRLVVVDLTRPPEATDDETPPAPAPEVPWVTALVVFVAMGSEPFWATVGLGQINLVLMALIVTDLLRLRGTRWAGALIGVAVGIKLTPAIFIVYLLLTRRVRAAATAIATTAATIALGAVLMARPTWDYFVDRTVLSEWWDTVLIVGKPGNQSLDGALTRWRGSEELARAPWLVAAAVVLIAGLGAAVVARRRIGEVGAMTLVAITGLLVAPTSWTHYWIWWILGACVLVAAACRTIGWRRLIAVVATVMWSLPFVLGRRWFPPYPEDIPTDRSLRTMMLDDMYVIAGVAAVVAVAATIAIGAAARRSAGDASLQ